MPKESVDDRGTWTNNANALMESIALNAKRVMALHKEFGTHMG